MVQEGRIQTAEEDKNKPENEKEIEQKVGRLCIDNRRKPQNDEIQRSF